MSELASEPSATLSVHAVVPKLTTPRRIATNDQHGLVLALYDAHQRELHTFVRSLERNPASAEDVVAETFFRLTNEIAAGHAPEQPRAWLFRVAANLVASGGRHRSVVTRVLGRIVDDRTDEPADQPAIRAESRRELLGALQGVSADARTALLLAAHGFSGRDIAATLGRSELATRSLMSRARLRLREQLEPREARR